MATPPLSIFLAKEGVLEKDLLVHDHAALFFQWQTARSRLRSVMRGISWMSRRGSDCTRR